MPQSYPSQHQHQQQPPPPPFPQTNNGPASYFSQKPETNQPSKKFRLDSPEGDFKTSIVNQLQNTINDLQQQLNALKNSSAVQQFPENVDLPNPMSADSSPSSVSLAERCDLPSLEIIHFYLDLYYEYFHPNHCFLLPKRTIYLYFSYRETECALIHAMFSVACRYVHTDPARAQRVQLQAFHKDPNYWTDLFQKHRKTLFTTPLIKALLLVGMSMSSGSNHQKSRQFAEEAYQLCLWNNLDKRFSQTSMISNFANTTLRGSVSVQQLLYRESLIRTVWEVWKFRVQVAIFSKDPTMIPHFNGDMCLPVSDTLYDNELKGWDYKRRYWNDLDAELLSGNDYINPNREDSIYNGACMSISCVNLLSLVFKHKENSSDMIVATLEERIKTLYSKLPPIDECLKHSRSYIFAHEALYTATLLLHYDKAQSFMVFLRSDPKKRKFTSPELAQSDAANKNKELVGIEKEQLELRNTAYLREFLACTAGTGANAEKCRSYLVCQWATHCLYHLLEYPLTTADPSTPQYQSSKSHMDFCLHLSPVTGYLLNLAIPVLASELVLQSIAMNMGGPQAVQLFSECVENYLAYPSFDIPANGTTSAAAVKSPSYSPDSPMSDAPHSRSSSTAGSGSGSGGGALARYGPINEITQKLKLLVTSEEVIGGVWEKVRDYNVTSRWVVSRTKEYEGVGSTGGL